jgi:predicted O-methyltransferase YrrM
MNISLLISGAATVSGVAVLTADGLRRHLRLSLVPRTPILELLDILSMALLAAFLAGDLVRRVVRPHGFRLALGLEAVCGIAMLVYLWGEGQRANQYQRPDGIVLGQLLVLAGLGRLPLRLLEGQVPAVDAWSIGSVLAGGTLTAVIVPRFLKRKEEHRIIERTSREGETSQPEYTPPTPECPNPGRWTMLDSMTAETEVLEFLKQLVLTLKPKLIVETGTFIGLSAIQMAEGLEANGFGRIVTCEFDPLVYEKAKRRIEASGLAGRIDCRNTSSLELRVEGTIDFFFSDSDLSIREQEIRQFLPQINSNGLILMHDTSSHYKVARQAAFRLEQEGLISMVLLPTPRGLMMAQKRAGRK